MSRGPGPAGRIGEVGGRSVGPVQCDYFDAGACGSCRWMGTPYAEQLLRVQQRAEQALPQLPGLLWEPVAHGPERGFRNRAKMVVGGTTAEPTLGILGPDGKGVDLRHCGLHEPALAATMPVLAGFVTRAGLTPYDVPARRGELKHVLATVSPDGELMVRWVLRSTEALPRLRKHLPWLQERLPALAVASANLQPDHKAVLEGREEVLLTGRGTLTMRVADLELHLRPQGFFQTDSVVAAALYRQAGEWISRLGPASVWDLYCGVGGFALTAARAGVPAVLGVELSTEAVQAARRSAERLSHGDVVFVAGDATAYATGRPVDETPDLVVVNPPRRGIGAELAGWLERSSVPHVLYSSCHLGSLATDLAAMPSLRPQQGRVHDMFPQTAHVETLVLLTRT